MDKFPPHLIPASPATYASTAPAGEKAIKNKAPDKVIIKVSAYMKINYLVLLLFALVVNTQLYGQKVELLDNTYYKNFRDRSDILNIAEHERSQVIMLLEPSLSSMIEAKLSADTTILKCVLIVNIERVNNVFRVYNNKPSFYQNKDKRYENIKISDAITDIVSSIKITPLLNRRDRKKISFGLVFYRK